MSGTLEPYQMIERSIIKKFRDELWKPFAYAVKKYELIRAGDRIAVCISGGRDSMLMQELHQHSHVPFELIFLVMDPGYNAINRQKIESSDKGIKQAERLTKGRSAVLLHNILREFQKIP